MTDFNKILDKAKELETKMRESQENIKKIRVEGVSGSNSVKVILDGEGEMQNYIIKRDSKEDKTIVEDLIVHLHIIMLRLNLKQKLMRKFLRPQEVWEFQVSNGLFEKCKQLTRLMI